jgi:hypothetical protein
VGLPYKLAGYHEAGVLANFRQDPLLFTASG